MEVQEQAKLSIKFVFAIFGLLCGAAHSQMERPIGLRSIFDLTLQELINTEIISASKQQEPVSQAPGTVYVITSDDIERFGFRFLQDALKIVPSVNLYQPHSWVWGGQRGLVSNFSQTLLLINGREVNNLIALEGFISRQFSTHNIERIEVIASPSSALYGANALAGIINIITRDGTQNIKGVEVGFEAGSFNSTALDAVFGFDFSDGYYLSGSFRQFQSDEEDFSQFISNENDFLGSWNDAEIVLPYLNHYANKSSATTYAAKLSKGSSYLGVYSYYNRQSHGLEKLSWNYSDNEDHRKFDLMYAGFDGKLSEKINLKLDYQYIQSKLWGRYFPALWPVSRLESSDNLSIYTFPDSVTTSTGQTLTGDEEIRAYYDSFASYLFDQNILAPGQVTPSDIHRYFTHIYTNKDSPGSIRQRIDTQLDWQISSNSSLTAGVSYDLIDYAGLAVTNAGAGLAASFDIPLDRSQRLSVYDSEKYAAFVQYKTSYLDQQLLLTTGFRYDHQNHYGGTINPRVSLVWNFNSSRLVELIYGEAFREPNVFELASDASIKPAKLKSIELNYNAFINESFQFSGTFYINEVSNFLGSVGSVIGTGVGQVDSQTVKGLELSAHAKWHSWLLFVSGSYIQSIEQQTIDLSSGEKMRTDGLSVPKRRINSGLTYQLADDYQASLLLLYTGSYRALSGNSAISEPFNIETSLVSNLNFIIKNIALSEIQGELIFSVNNVTDKDYYHPNIRRSGPHSFLQEGRSFTLSWKSTF